MKICSAVETKKLMAYAMEKEAISSIDLMERAAQMLTVEFTSFIGMDRPVKVFAGAHNNGGDALAMSRMLSKKGYDVEVFLFNTKNELTPECAENRDRLIQTCPGAQFHEITRKFDLPNLTKDDVVIDGLFGIGLSRPLSGSYALLVKFINQSEATVVSIDIPSGLMCEGNDDTLTGQIIEADYTLSVETLKPSFLMADSQKYIGKCKILPLNISADDYDGSESRYLLDDEDAVKHLIKPRDPFGNKGTFGHGLLVAGSYGMAGAAVIAARAAMSCGMGKLTVHTPSTNNTILQCTVPEAIIHNDVDNFLFSKAESTEGYDAVAIGPGLGHDKDTPMAFIDLVSRCERPLVIDADGLNILAEHKGWLQQIPKNSILTPHPKEFARIFGPSHNDFDRLNQASEQAMYHHVYIVLKGHYTAICTPDGLVYFNTTGNSGMASAGTGDALTGVLLSLLAQGYSAEDACKLGCYLHGLAGDMAAEELSEEGMNVKDLVHYLPYAIKRLKRKD